MTFGTFILGLVMTGIGILFTAKSETLLSFFGRVDWAEQNLQFYGGTRIFYKLIGIFLIFVGLLTMTGLGGAFARGTLGRLLGMH